MRKVIISALRIYQVVFSSLLKNLLGVSRFCRFEQTCSDYSIASIEKFGVLKGLSLSVVRILRCQPFYHERAHLNA